MSKAAKIPEAPLRARFAVEVLGWQWVSHCWKDRNGKYRMMLPEWLWELRTDQIRTLLKYEKAKRKEKPE